MLPKEVEVKKMSDENLVQMYLTTQNNIYFECLYQRYSDKVYRKCLMFTKDPARAEDFTHDIFLRLIVKLGSFKQKSSFSTWLFSITYNYCTDQLRVIRRQSETALDEGENWADDTDDDFTAMSGDRLAQALGGLTVEEQALLLMKYQDEISVKDIAAIENVTESAIKMRLKRAKEKLRRRYLETLLFWLVLFAKLASMLR